MVVSPNKDHLEQIEDAVEENLNTQIAKITFLLPDQIVDYLGQNLEEPPTETTVKGFKVKVTRKPLSVQEQQKRKDAIASVIAKSMQKLG